MSHDNRRAERVAEAIRAEVAPFLAEGGGAKDPRIVALVTVTGVDVTRDLRHAVIYVSVMGSDAERASTLEGLASVAGHLRHRLAGTLRLRMAPEIAFKLDESIAKAARIETLLAQIERDRDASDAGGATPAPDA
ncbi:MAG TPA: 30S ribosome-binding factor RbfA [Gemmatimonadaceae bacterium]|nr:30S ribosome-binding factor RbfA [Gemmatimonadaceae bacterium]